MRISDWSSDVCSSDLEAAENPRLVHPAQHRFGIARAGQHVEEQLIRARVTPHALRLDQLGVVARLPHRLRMDFETVLVGERENLDQPHRLLRSEERGVGKEWVRQCGYRCSQYP